MSMSMTMPRIINGGVTNRQGPIADRISRVGDLPHSRHQAIQIHPFLSYWQGGLDLRMGFGPYVETVEATDSATIVDVAHMYALRRLDKYSESNGGAYPPFAFIDTDRIYATVAFWAYIRSQRASDTPDKDHHAFRVFRADRSYAWHADRTVDWYAQVITGIRRAIADAGAPTKLMAWGLHDAVHASRPGYVEANAGRLRKITGMLDITAPHIYVGDAWSKNLTPRELFQATARAVRHAKDITPTLPCYLCTRMCVVGTRNAVPMDKFEAIVEAAAFAGADGIKIWEDAEPSGGEKDYADRLELIKRAFGGAS